MFVIRKAQMDFFDEAATNDFENRMFQFLKSAHPDEILTSPESAVRSLIRNGIQKAAEFGVIAEPDVAKFIHLMHLLSETFYSDERTPWMRHVLENSEITPHEKMVLLYEKA